MDLNLVTEIALIFGGLGLFIFGATFLNGNLKTIADGDRFRKTMGKVTNNRLKAFGLGTGFTALIQSSGGTMTLSVGLVKAGALNYKSAVAVIIGANIGTCITAFLISIPGISMFMPFVTAVAALMIMVVKNRKVQLGSRLALGFSLIFFGILLMERNVKAVVIEPTPQPWFMSLMNFMNTHPWVGLLFGTIVTLGLQSSSAVVGILQGIFAASFVSGASSSITLFGVLPIVFGANIGAVIPCILAAIGGSQTAKRVAFLNTLMKVSSALLFMGLIYAMQSPLSSLNSQLNSNNAKFVLAVGHLIFNVAGAVIFLPLLNPLCRLGELVYKDKKEVGAKIAFKELDPEVIKNFPSTGVSLANDLSIKMFEYVYTMFKKIKNYKKEPSDDLKDYIQELERATDNIDRHLADFLLNAETGELSRRDLKSHGRIMRAIKDIERIGDYGENLLTFYQNIFEKKNTFVKEQDKEINEAHQMALDIIEDTMDVYERHDKKKALDIIQRRRDMNAKLDEYQEAYFKRQEKRVGGKNDYISLIYVDILNSYERVYSHCANIAKLFNTDKDIDRYSENDKTKFTNMKLRY